MSGTVKKMYQSEGVSVTAPTDLGIATSTTHIETYANDAAYVSANGTAQEGDIYHDSTLNCIKYYSGGAWGGIDADVVAAHIANTSNPHSVDASDVGLGNVDNTSDATKNAAAVVLTNKDIDGGTASNTSRITVPKAATATLTGLTRKAGTIVYDTDLSKPYYDNGSSLVAFGSGSGSGEKNYITNPSAADAVTGWTAVGDLVVARTTTAADLPREYTTAAGIKITADADTQSTADYVYFDFNLDDVDLSKKLKIQWAQKVTGTYTAGQLAVVITTQADRTTALHTPIVTAIPAADGVFTTSFDASTTAALSLVIRATGDMTTDGGIVISDVVVGPGTTAQGAAVSEWISFTPTGSWSTNTTYEGRYQRIGSTMELEYVVSTSGAPTSATFSVNLPSGFTMDTTKLPTGISNVNSILGQAYILDSGTTTYYGGVAYDSTTSFRILSYAYGSRITVAAFVTQAEPMTFASGDKIHIRVSVPIAEWSGSGTLNVIQDDTLNEWQSWTPTLGTGARGTGTSEKAYWRRVGDTMECLYFYTQTGAGTAGSGAYTWSLPSGYTIDTTQLTTGAANTGSIVGNGYVYDGTNERSAFVTPSTTTSFGIGFFTSATASSQMGSSNIAFSTTVVKIMVNFRVPIAEWRGKSGTGPVGFLMADTLGNAGLVNPYGGTGVVYGGASTPTWAAGSNTSSRTGAGEFYQRIGSIVMVQGCVTIVSTSGFCRWYGTLPVTSALASVADLRGQISARNTSTSAMLPGFIDADFSGTIEADFNLPGTGSATYDCYYSYSYRII